MLKHLKIYILTNLDNKKLHYPLPQKINKLSYNTLTFGAALLCARVIS